VKKGILAVVSAAGLFFGSLDGTAHAIVIQFVPGVQTVSLGDTVDVEVRILDLGGGAPPSLGAFDLDVTFDPSILTPTAVTFGAFLGDPSLLEAVTGFTFFPGLVDLFETSFLSGVELDALQPDPMLLATLSFDAVGLGTSALVFTDVILGDALGDPLIATWSSGSVTVTGSAVPVPGTAWLLAPCFVILFLWRRCGWIGCPAANGMACDPFPSRSQSRRSSWRTGRRSGSSRRPRRRE
jgi:hypothetical protein